MRLQGKVAIVTGGASGIGRATARRFASEGAAVSVADINDTGGKQVAETIVAEGGKASFVHADVTRQADASALVQQTLAQFGRLDILVNNAGGASGDSLEEIDEATWDWNFDLVLKSVYFCSRAAIPRLLEGQGGCIVNISSVNGLTAIGQDAYSAAKAAVVSLTQNIAVRYGPRGLRANVICPGTVQTEAWRRTAERSPDVFQRVARLYPLRRVGRPEDIANAALFLASDEAAFVNGAVLVVDGGLTAGTDLFRRVVSGETTV